MISVRLTNLRRELERRGLDQCDLASLVTKPGAPAPNLKGWAQFARRVLSDRSGYMLHALKANGLTFSLAEGPELNSLSTGEAARRVIVSRRETAADPEAA